MLGYKVEGNGPPLLMIHGWGISYNIWQNLLPYLTPHFQVIMIELPGIGDTPLIESSQPYRELCAEAIDEVRQKLGIERWWVFSYSSGTRMGEAYVRRYAPHVQGAVFLCPVSLSWWRSLTLWAASWLDSQWSGAGNWVLSGWRLHRLIWVLGFNGRSHPYVLEWMREIGSQPVDSLKITLRSFPKMGHAPFEVSGVPTLFVWGRWDIINSRPRRPRLNDRFIPAAHSAPVLAPEAVVRAILPFLQGQGM